MMARIIVKSDTLIGEIQREFNDVYPYLRMEFFKNSAKYSLEEELGLSMPLGNLGNFEGDRVIDIGEGRTIQKLEEDFRQLDLFVRVLRQSGRSWITTSLTKDWTLERQNAEGALMSTIHEATPRNEIDWDD